MLTNLPVRKLFVVFFLGMLLLSACAPAAAPTAAPTKIPTPVENQVPVPAGVTAGLKELAGKLGLAVDQFQVRTIRQVQWPNACLGLPNKDEMCAEVVTDGYEAVVDVNGKRYELHTNADGSAVRWKDVQASTGGQGDQLPGAVRAAVEELAKQTGYKLDTIKVVRFEHVDWSDSCLGVPFPDRSCLQAITPGYLVMLEANGEQFEFHTNEVGDVVFLMSKQ